MLSRQNKTVRGRGNLTHLGHHRRRFQNSTETSVERLFRIVALRASPAPVSEQASAPRWPALGPFTGRGREPGLSSPGDSSCGPGSHSPPGARWGEAMPSHWSQGLLAGPARGLRCEAEPCAPRAQPRPPRSVASPRLSQLPSDLCERRLSLPGCQFLAHADRVRGRPRGASWASRASQGRATAHTPAPSAGEGKLFPSSRGPRARDAAPPHPRR